MGTFLVGETHAWHFAGFHSAFSMSPGKHQMSRTRKNKKTLNIY